jgi:CIC family chloride channel protein
VTHDFEITATVLTAALCATTLVRERFGYSFSTWRLHLRGEVIKSARDIGWARSLTAGRMMRQAPATASTGLTIAGFRELFPLGSTTRVLLEDDTGRYAGIVPTAAAYADTGDEARPVSELRILEGATLTPEMDIAQVMRRFDDSAADDMAVVDRRGNILGILTEKYVRKRYADELDKAQRELFGET